ncbi:hypothetical protein niasHS_007841 [Heterodera schachtii]|uniref:G-protein coupled receptors family 1 profile domain-containing protein n=1 Tax=Heterodera schachtii TaxID=97005 RepID=A0ABD2JPZ5_HETSC
MDFYLNSHDNWVGMYNCSRVSVDGVPLWARQRTINGTLMLILFFIFEILYIPCLIAIWKHRAQPCYKFLFFIGITDVLMLPIHGLVSSLYSLFGVVFCSNASFNYFIASCGAALFAAESSANLFLALDRLVETFSPKYNQILFSGQRAWLWTMVSSSFGFYYFWEVKPAVFSPSYGNWFLNPYQDYSNISVDTRKGA